MTGKKFKSIGIVFLSIIYFTVLCMGSLSYAINSISYDNFIEGKYYIKNKGTSYFMSSVDFYSVVQTPYNPDTDLQKWELEYVSNGYYRVKNVYSGYYLTAAGAYYPGENITETALSSSSSDQLWHFSETEIDTEYREYKITAGSYVEDAFDLALTGDTTATSYGYMVVQEEYSADTDYCDEWILIPCRDAYLVGITNTSTNHEHTTCLNRVETTLLSDYFDVNRITTSATTAYTVKTYMQNSETFILRADGGCDDIGTYMYLNSSDSTVKLHSWDLYNYNGNTGIDLSKCYVAVFAGCYTADHATQSLPQAATDAGAIYAVGFSGAPDCSLIAEWTKAFATEYIITEVDVEAVVNDVNYDMGFNDSTVQAKTYQ
ncbi:MAG: RICIN domain-containing protein [Clostridia bacterium]|nr:RICIN domain-containing protein [Clostridia bacterium]